MEKRLCFTKHIKEILRCCLVSSRPERLRSFAITSGSSLLLVTAKSTKQYILGLSKIRDCDCLIFLKDKNGCNNNITQKKIMQPDLAAFVRPDLILCMQPIIMQGNKVFYQC